MGRREALPRDGIQVFIPPATRDRAREEPAGMRILVMEDDPDVRTLVRLALRLDGHRVVEAATPAEGLLRATESVPDLILLDARFPGADGISALRTLRETEETSEVPVILLSGRTDPEDQLRGLREGADLYLTKPFDPLALLSTVREMAELSPTERSQRRVKELARLRLLVGPSP